MDTAKIQYQIGLRDFGIEDFHIHGLSSEFRSRIDIAKVGVSLGLFSASPKDSDLLEMRYSAAFLYHFPEHSEPVVLFSMIAAFEFFLQDRETVVRFNEPDLTMPDHLHQIFSSIAISTMRGMAKVKCAGTYLEKIVIPIIDPADFVANHKKRVVS